MERFLMVVLVTILCIKASRSMPTAGKLQQLTTEDQTSVKLAPEYDNVFTEPSSRTNLNNDQISTTNSIKEISTFPTTTSDSNTSNRAATSTDPFPSATSTSVLEGDGMTSLSSKPSMESTEDKSASQMETPCSVLSNDTTLRARDVFRGYCDYVNRIFSLAEEQGEIWSACGLLVSHHYNHFQLPEVVETTETPNIEDMSQNLRALGQINHTLSSLVKAGVATLLNSECYGIPGNKDPCSLACEKAREDDANFYCAVGSRVLPRVLNQILVLRTKLSDIGHAVDTPYKDLPVSEFSSRSDLMFFNLGAIYYTHKQAEETHKAVAMYGKCS